jgi:hypothetical protein
MATKDVVIYGTGTSKHLPAGSQHTVNADRAKKYIEQGIATDKAPTEKKVVPKKTAEKKAIAPTATKEKVQTKGPGTITTANVKKDGDTKSDS